MSDRPLFTVFTPTYNRGAVLHRVYESLLDQTFRDFEWLVIDDGSTDDTKDRVARWAREAWFPIRYFRQHNAGKHIAFNRAVREARGELFLVADSDDAFFPQTLERFRHHWLTIPERTRNRFAGVTALCLDAYGRLVGDRFPVSPLDADSLTMSYQYRVGGEKWGVQRTDVLRHFPFPELKGVKFIPESVVWHRIARHYKTRFVNEALRIYYRDQPDQLTHVAAEGAPSRAYYYSLVLLEESDWMRSHPVAALRSAILYARFATLAGLGVKGQWKCLRGGTARYAWIVGLLPGKLLAVADRRAPNLVRNLKRLRQQQKPLRFLLSRFLWWSGLCRYFVIARPGYELRFHPSSLAATYWVGSNGWNADENIIRTILQPGDSFVDVGANIGALTLAAASSVGQKGYGVAVEAHPRVCGYLRENLILNGIDWVKVVGCAVGRCRGMVRLSNKREDDQNTVELGGGIEVPQRTLDELCDGIGEIALIKLDVEGYEPEVLLGGRQTLRRTRCIYMEVWDAHLRRYGWDPARVQKMLEEMGFTLYRWSKDGLAPVERPLRAWICENFLAVRERDRKWLVERLSKSVGMGRPSNILDTGLVVDGS